MAAIEKAPAGYMVHGVPLTTTDLVHQLSRTTRRGRGATTTSAPPPLSYRDVMNVLDLGDRAGWYDGLSVQQKNYLKTTMLHAAGGHELYRVDDCVAGEVARTATVSRLVGLRTPEARRQRYRYCVMSCRTIPGQFELHGPFFYYFRTRGEADAAAASAVAVV